MPALGRMLVSFSTDPRSAATSWHRAEADAEVDGDGEAEFGAAPVADAGEPAELPLEPHAAASSTRLDRRRFRQTWRLNDTRLILRERGS